MNARYGLLGPFILALLLCASYQAQAAQVDCILHGNSPGERGIIDSTGAGCTDEDRQWYKDNKAKIDALKKEMQPASEREIARIKQETEANQRALEEEHRAAATKQAAQRAAEQAANLRAQQDANQNDVSLAPYATYERNTPRALPQPSPKQEPQKPSTTVVDLGRTPNPPDMRTGSGMPGAPSGPGAPCGPGSPSGQACQ